MTLRALLRAAAAVGALLPMTAGASPLLHLEWSDLAHVHGPNCGHAGYDGSAALNGASVGGSSSGSGSVGALSLPLNPNGTAGQVVFVDFSAPSPTFRVALRRLGQATAPAGQFFVSPNNGRTVFDTWVYTPEQRAEILEATRRDYRGLNVQFTDVRPTSGDFQTSRLNALGISGGAPNITAIEVDTDGDGVFTPGVDRYSFSILFGQADRIDFGNRVRNDVARTDANLWTFLNQAGFASIGGVPVTDTAVVRQLITQQATSTGSHEVGHNLGLRHHDAAGPIGAGVNNLGNALTATRFDPPYPGPRAAVDTNLHIMSSGASTGESIDPRGPAFFGLREAAKLAHNEQAPLTDTEATLATTGPINLLLTGLPQIFGNFGDNRGFLDLTSKLEFTSLALPNTIEAGVELTNSIARGPVNTVSARGSLSLPTTDAEGRILDIDMFAVDLVRNSRVSLEIFSVGTLVVQYAMILDKNLNIAGYYGTPAVNLFEGEGNTPFILDFIPTRTGRYYIATWSPFGLLDDPRGFNLAPGQFASGNYELYLAQFQTPAPGALALFGLGAAGLLAARRRARD